MAVVKVICKNLKRNPSCPHGPTLRFVRIKDGEKKEFYACSAYRSRKTCSFYMEDGSSLTSNQEENWSQEKKRLLPTIDHSALECRYETVKQTRHADRLYCHNCSELDTDKSKHRSHEILTPLSDAALTQPSLFMKPIEGTKKEAQYFFNYSTTKVIAENLKRAGVERVLCLGTPRVHEHIQGCCPQMQSILLDIDHRYHSFWPRDKFVWFNMFNHHVLGSRMARKALRDWMTVKGSKALVLDPPFGGHVAALTATVNFFCRLVRPEKLVVIWVFPYFRELHVTNKCPFLMMIDYKVLYDNHKTFRKDNSPVRIFTNILPGDFELPALEGYRLCRLCCKWVAKNNKHCHKCGFCPSKNATTYNHCDACQSCVKPSWQHCFDCKRCLPIPHQCRGTQQTNSEENDESKESRHKRILKFINISGSKKKKLKTE